MIRLHRPFVSLWLLGLCCALPAAAQYTEDEQTRDHEEQDRRYLERYTRPQQPPPPENPQALAAAYLVRAEELIRDRNYRSKSGTRYRVQTDDPRLNTGAAVELLEGFRAFFDGFWKDRAELKPYDATSRVFLFYSFHKFDQLISGDWKFRRIRPKGHYAIEFDVITLHTDADAAANLPDSLVHEATHQLIERRLFGGAGQASNWVSEGLASYFGYTFRDGAGAFQAGAVGGKSLRLLDEGPAGAPTQLGDALRQVRAALKQPPSGQELVAWLLSAEQPERFYGDDDAPLRYAVSWLLVHFLFHGDGGEHAAAFVRYLELEARAEGGTAAFHREIGLDAPALGTRLAQHVKSLRVR